MSTYITAVVAGEYHEVLTRYDGKHGEIPLGIYCRAVAGAAPRRRRHPRGHQAGLRILRGDRSPCPYPFGKYDQLFVPEFNAGAMENAGCVTFRDEYIFRSKVTDARYERRANTILHEMAHMWFGDLVTMSWWDDLWLNESFAEWASLRERRGDPLHRVLDDVLQRPQELGLPPGPAALHAPDRRRQCRTSRRSR